MSALVLPFSNNILSPGDIIIGDACWVYDYYYSTNITNGSRQFDEETLTRMKEVKEFSEELVKNNNLIALPPICRQELIQVCERDFIGNETFTSKQEMTKDGTLIVKSHDIYQQIEQALKEDPLFFIDDMELHVDIDKAIKISNEENLKLKDAYYVLYGRENEVNNIATVDKDFVRIMDPNFNIYVNKKAYNFYLTNSPLTNNLAQYLKRAK